MDMIGRLNGIPVYLVEDIDEINENINSNNLYILNKKVYQHGVYVGKYNRSKNSIDWLPQEPERTEEPSPQRCEYCHTTGDHNWKELLKSVDDMIAEMLGREQV